MSSRFFGSMDLTPVSDGLQKLTSMFVSLSPKDSIITFDFDQALHVHVDMRRFEETTIMEAVLPTICGGIFHKVRRGMAKSGHSSIASLRMLNSRRARQFILQRFGAPQFTCAHYVSISLSM